MRKILYVVLDGMGDLPIKDLGGLTPLEAATTPNMDALGALGRQGVHVGGGRGLQGGQAAQVLDGQVTHTVEDDVEDLSHRGRNYRSGGGIDPARQAEGAEQLADRQPAMAAAVLLLVLELGHRQPIREHEDWVIPEAAAAALDRF